MRPNIHKEAYVAPNATLRGDVTIEKGTSVLFGAIITAEGGAVIIRENSVVMEHAVIRGTPRHPATIGHSVLVGPYSHLSGCTIDEEVFIATGSTIFNGAHIKRGSEVRINGIIHINTVLEADSVVPIGWVAVGDPAQMYPPGEHEKIWETQRDMDFPQTVFGVDRKVSKGERTRKYAKALMRHKKDRLIDD